MNNVVLIGKLASTPTHAPLKEYYTHVINVDVDGATFGVYVWKNMADIIADNYPIGTVLGIKASLKTYDGQLYIVANRISFITENNHD